jgi:hypothetical protein
MFVLLVHAGAKAFAMFQAEMRTLLNEMKARGPPPEDDQDIAAQLYRVRRTAARATVLSLFTCQLLADSGAHNLLAFSNKGTSRHH